MNNNLHNLDKKIRNFYSRYDKSESRQKNLNLGANYGILFNIGVELVAHIFVGILLGTLLDKYFNCKPFILLTCILLSCISAYKSIINRIK
jgi:F0F1-type ATP synthase assembly protein I